MSAMLQNLDNGDSAWHLPTDLRQYDEERAFPGKTWPVAAAPWAQAPNSRYPQWHNTHDASSDKDQQFMDLLAAYRGSGGLARTQELICKFKRGDGGGTAQLARWIVARQVISIEWQDQTWFPWFQFDSDIGRPQSAMGHVVRELCSVLDDWEVARWFVQPNAWLDDATPVEHLTRRPTDVLEAARARRLLGTG